MKSFIEVTALRNDAYPPRLSEDGMSLDIYSFCIAETGRNNSVLIPQRDVRPVRTGHSVKISPNYHGLFFIGSKEYLLFPTNSLWLSNDDQELVVELYNGGYEAQYVEHGQLIARLILHPSIQMSLKNERKEDATVNS